MILEALFESRSARASAAVSPGSQAGPFWGGSGDSMTGLSITPTTSLANTAVLQAVQVISSIMGAMPKITYDRGLGEGVRAQRHNLYYLLHDQPNPEMTAAVFQEACYVNKLLHGNMYAEIERSPTGMPLALWFLPADLVTPRRVFKRVGGGITIGTSQGATPESRRSGGEIWYQVIDSGGSAVWINSLDMFHVPHFSFDGLVGLSPVRVAMETIGVGTALIGSAAAIFGNSGAPGGVLERPETAPELTPTGEATLLAAFEARHSGVRKRGRVAVLQEGTKFNPTTLPAQELQFVQMLQQQIPLVAQIFNLPAYFLNHDGSKNTYANVESIFELLVKQTLLIHAEKEEQEIYRKLVSEREGARIYVEYEFKQLLRGDSAARASFYKTMRELGVMSPNDIARAENLPPVPAGQGGDDYRPAAAAPAAAPAANGAGTVARSLLRVVVERAHQREAGIVRKEAGRLLASGATTLLSGWVDEFYVRQATELAAEVHELGGDRWAMGEAVRHRRELRDAIAAAEPAAALTSLLDRWSAETHQRAEALALEVGA